MNKRILYLNLLLQLGLTWTASAATNYVLQGYDFQTNINNATGGDTMVVQAGIYTGDLTFTKPLTILCSGTNQVQFQGSVQVQTTGTISFSQCLFLSPLQVLSNCTLVMVQAICSNALT